MKGTVCYWLRCGVAYQQARCAVPLFIFSEICLKSNGSSVVNNLFQCQTTNYMASSSKSHPSSLFHPSLSCFCGMLEGIFWIPLSSFVTAILMASKPCKRVLDDPLELGGKKSPGASKNLVPGW